ncbi:MAG TPA: ABC transporter substrate-binding protein [Thermoanaerobaculia bacterium]|nr:ABC transporter substrate-binding protein [Thermoanaerobaculia bacterium]
MTGRRLFFLTCSLSCCLACARPQGALVPADDELVVALESAPTSLDPRVATDQSSARVFAVLLNGLASKDERGNPIPDLARWEVHDGGRRYRFHLKPGVRFHDGRPLRPADVVWTFRTILDGSVATSKRGAFPQLERVAAAGPAAVDFHLSEPFGAFPLELTTSMGVVPAGTTPEAMNRRPIGTGPFRVVERSPERIVLARFDGHHAGPPRLDRIVFKVVPDATVRALELLKGSVQLVVNDLPPDLVPRFRADRRYRVIEGPGATYSYLGLNLTDPLLRDLRVRRALALAIDREQLVEALWRGLGRVTETMIPHAHWAHHAGLPPTPYDPAAARRLLDAAGLRDPDGDGPRPRFALTYKTSTNEPYVLQAQAIQAMLARVGVDLRVRTYEFATFYEDVRKGNFQVFAMLRLGVLDPHVYRLVLHSASLPPAGQNRGRYLNARFDRLIDQGARLTAPAARRPYYLEAQEILARDLPYISLYIRTNVAVMPAELEGYRSYLNGELLSLREVHWSRRVAD